MRALVLKKVHYFFIKMKGSVEVSHVSRQLLRCIYHQLKSHRILCSIFVSKISSKVFAVLAAMRDIRQLCLSEVLKILLEKENENSVIRSIHFLRNLRCYLEAYDHSLASQTGSTRYTFSYNINRILS